MLTDIIPAEWRARVYAAYAFLAVALTVMQTVYLTTQTPQPMWLTVAFAVFAVVGTAIGAVAKANVPEPEPKRAVVEPAVPVSVFVIDGVTSTRYSDGTVTRDSSV